MVAVPVFVGGFRSGTTLLINYLGLHPRLSAIYETKFLADLLRIVRIVRDEEGRGELEIAVLRELGWHPACSREEAIAFLIQRARQDIALTQAVLDGLESDGKAAYERYALGANHILWSAAEALEAIEPFVQGVRAGTAMDTLLSALGAGVRSLFTHHADREGKRCWVNKTPEILRFQSELRQILGRVRFIHLVRDGRDVVFSSVKLGWWSVAVGSRVWRTFIEDVRAQAAYAPEDYLELRYEELVGDHTGSLARVLDFLGIDGDPGEIVIAQERQAPGSTSRQEAERRMGQWRLGMTAADRATFKAIANDLLVSLGYARDAGW